MGADAVAAAVGLLRAFPARHVLELGSGRSTVDLARAVRDTSGARFWSVEHSERFLDRTRAALDEVRLADAAHVVHAPVRIRRCGPFVGRWYGDLPNTGGPPFDFVLVDGPPARTVGRFMGLPLLWHRLATGALLLVDDANRPHLEGAWIDLWRRLYGDALRVEIYSGFQKGLALMMKTMDRPYTANPALWTRWARAAIRHEVRRLAIAIGERTPRERV